MSLLTVPKKVLFDLAISHAKLSAAEYRRNKSYNDEHFSAKAEKVLIEYLNSNKELSDEFFDLLKKEL
jgi:uncharacterized membrane protein YvbJ